MNNTLSTRALVILEFDKVLKQLSDCAISDGGKKKTLELLPVSDVNEILSWQEETSAAKHLYQVKGLPSFADLKNIEDTVDRTRLGAALSMRELLDIASVLRTIRRLKEYRGENETFSTCLDEYFTMLTPNKYLEDKIFNIIISEEEISDHASGELYDIRRKIKNAENKVRDVLNKLIHSQTYVKYLQDPIVTVRDGRFVVPVKAEHRGDVAGLVHDTSGSGSTVFIEPMGVVEANNEIRVLKGKEKDEIDRILAALSAEVSDFSDSIKRNYETAVKIDFIFAKGKLSEKQRAIQPKLNTKGHLDFKKARHPLLSKDTVVPINISIGKDYDTLVITGPNTGGKTVSLKTTGLLTIMAGAGLHIPVGEGSEAAVFNNVFADIGDEQSIEQSLSTFSSHMKNIVGILKNADKNSLVLFDELGAGTDPVEGAALATSILEHIRAQGAKTIATTHYAELKIYAIETEGVENASCEFDIESLKPTYRLITGIPGRSNAFAIAGRLGLSEDIIDNAAQHISKENLKFENVIADLEKNRIKLEEDMDEAAKLKFEAERLKIEAQQMKNKIEGSVDKELERAKSEAKRVIASAKLSVGEIIDELDELRRQKDSADFKEKLNALKIKASASMKKIEDEADPIKAYEENYTLPRPLKIGDTVAIKGIDKTATVKTLPDSSGYLTVAAGMINTKVNINDLRLTDYKSDKKTSQSYNAKLDNVKNLKGAKNELDIRGMTSYEAEPLIDDFLYKSVMAGLSVVTIIHGKGTGSLRKAVHIYLKSNANVKSYRLGVYGEGESGVTIVELK